MLLLLYTALLPFAHSTKQQIRKESTGLATQTYSVKVVRVLPHINKPFTQGFEIDHDSESLIETSGSFPPGTESYIRSIDPTTGQTKWKTTDCLNGAFIEGITRVSGKDGHWFASVYQEPRRIIEFNSEFKCLGSHPLPFKTDGWGLTRTPDNTAFLATNGTSTVMKLDQKTFQILETKVAMCGGKPVPGLNELEMVDNFQGKGPALLGNVYTTRILLALDPNTMECTGAFSLDKIDESVEAGEKDGYHVANGIAYNQKTDTFFLTGKNWNKMFEVKLEEEPEMTSGADSAFAELSQWQESVHRAPGLGLIQLGPERSFLSTRVHKPEDY